jgi:hypothetical protein
MIAKAGSAFIPRVGKHEDRIFIVLHIYELPGHEETKALAVSAASA